MACFYSAPVARNPTGVDKASARSDETLDCATRSLSQDGAFTQDNSTTTRLLRGALAGLVAGVVAFFDDRGRSGVFRLGLDHALFAADGRSTISVEDYAVAMIDELEQPRHSHRRFTVGY